MASIIVKTPNRTLPNRSSKKKQMLFLDEIERSAAKICIGALSKNIEKAYEDQVSIIATFFQRLISRTPVDEKYERIIITKTGEKKVIKHKPDGEKCREHWFIEDTKTGDKIYSKRFIKGPDSFNVVNNSTEINEIKEAVKRKFPIKKYLDEEPVFAVGNDSKHFERIEYGYSQWKNDTSPVIGAPIGREHGVKNRHSVQAPVGMLRITEAELESIRRRPSFRSLRSRYKGGLRTNVTPSDKKLEEFYKILKRGHRIKYADIKRYLEMY